MVADILHISIQALVTAALRDPNFRTYNEIEVGWPDVESAMTALYGAKENWQPHDQALLLGEVRNWIGRAFQPWECA